MSHRGIKLVHLPAPRLGPLTTLWFDLRSLIRAAGRYDVIYMLGYGSGFFCFIPRLFGGEVWINMDGIEWRRSKWNGLARRWLRWMEGAAVRSADRIVADAEAVLDELQSRHRVRSASVIPYGAHPVVEAPEWPLDAFGVTKEGYYLVVCRLEPENHVAEIVEGYLDAAPDYPLVVLGDIDAPTGYAARLREIRDPRVRFAGTLYDRERLHALRFHARAYFHGHSVGGTNPSLLEALGCGNLVIAHDNPFNREVAGPHAFYFSRPEEIAGSLARIESLSDAERAEQRDGARRRIAERYTWERIADAYLELLAAGAGLPEQVRG